MAVSNPPAFMDQDTYAAQFDRRWLGYDFLQDSSGTSIRTALGGIVSTGDLLVTENGTPNMTVNVAAGACYIRGTSISNQGIYRCVASSTTNLAISAAHATLERWDLAVGRIYDNTHDGSGQHVWALEIVTGTPSGSPSEPALPASSFKLARVTVPATDTTITNSQIINSALLLNFQPSATAVAFLGSSEFGKQIRSGTGTANLTNGQTATNTTLSFGATFATTPKVTIAMGALGGGAVDPGYAARVSAKTTTGFTIRMSKFDGSAFGANGTVDIDWIAVG